MKYLHKAQFLSAVQRCYLLYSNGVFLIPLFLSQLKSWFHLDIPRLRARIFCS